MVAIEMDGLTKQFGTVTAVRDFDLTVEQGEVFGFLGPNGAGKSTTIDMLLDFVRPTAGRISILGYDPQETPRAVRQRVGIVPENFGLFETLSGRRHVDFAIEMRGADDDPEVILDRVGLGDAGKQAAGDYSKGMRQRLVLGMALVGEPDVLILDEPSSGLDPNGARDLRQIVREEAARGAAVFFSSHVLEQVEAVCDRVGIINTGELVTVSTIDDLRDSVGAGSRLVLTVDVVPDDHGLLALDGVTDVEAGDGVIRIACAPGIKSAVIDRVEAAGATVTDISVEETSLEELFSEYTVGGMTA